MDWTKVIGELADMGYTQPKIATECLCGQATVSDLASGKTTDPRFGTALMLLALLHKARIEAKQAEAKVA